MPASFRRLAQANLRLAQASRIYTKIHTRRQALPDPFSKPLTVFEPEKPAIRKWTGDSDA